MKKIVLVTCIIASLFIAVFSQTTRLGGKSGVGGRSNVYKPAVVVSGRAIIFDGINDYLTDTDTGTSVPSTQNGWRFVAKVRGLSDPSGTTYLYYDFGGETLQIRHDPGGSFGSMQAVAIGPGFASGTGFISVPSTDVIILVRSNPAGSETSLEIWNASCGGRVADQNTSATTSATNFQSRNIALGATISGTNFITARVDVMGFLTGAGTFNGTCPDPLTTTFDIMEWKFDSDNGNDTSGNAVNLTMNGSPAFENTP